MVPFILPHESWPGWIGYLMKGKKNLFLSPKIGRGKGRSRAVWIFSENSSVLADSGFPKGLRATRHLQKICFHCEVNTNYKTQKSSSTGANEPRKQGLVGCKELSWEFRLLLPQTLKSRGFEFSWISSWECISVGILHIKVFRFKQWAIDSYPSPVSQLNLDCVGYDWLSQFPWWVWAGIGNWASVRHVGGFHLLLPGETLTPS